MILYFPYLSDLDVGCYDSTISVAINSVSTLRTFFSSSNLSNIFYLLMTLGMLYFPCLFHLCWMFRLYDFNGHQCCERNHGYQSTIFYFLIALAINIFYYFFHLRVECCDYDFNGYHFSVSSFYALSVLSTYLISCIFQCHFWSYIFIIYFISVLGVAALRFQCLSVSYFSFVYSNAPMIIYFLSLFHLSVGCCYSTISVAINLLFLLGVLYLGTVWVDAWLSRGASPFTVIYW